MSNNRIVESEGMDELSTAFEVDAPESAEVEAPVRSAPEVSEDEDLLSDDDSSIETPVKAPKAAERVIEIKGAKGKKTFKLDPEDKELQRTLSFGVGAGQWKKERDEARAEIKRLKAERDAEAPVLSPLKQAKTLAERGYTEHAVKALLGEEGYRQFVKSAIAETIDYENADEVTKSAIEKTRLERDKSFEVEQRENRIKELEDRINAREEEAMKSSFKSLGTQYLSANSFSNYIKNAELADKLDQKLWKLAMSDLEDIAEAEGDDAITPERMKKAFAENGKVLRAGMVKAAKERTRAIVETKKETAKQAAQQIATSRYPGKTEAAADNKKWKSAKDLLGLMIRR